MTHKKRPAENLAKILFLKNSTVLKSQIQLTYLQWIYFTSLIYGAPAPIISDSLEGFNGPETETRDRGKKLLNQP